MSIHTKMGGCVYICINTLIAVYVSLTKVGELTQDLILIYFKGQWTGGTPDTSD